MPAFSVTNQIFLETCFGAGEWGRAHVTGFEEDPSDLEALGLRGHWGGEKAFRYQGLRALPGQNAYFVISTFKDDPATGKGLRRKALFEAMHVAVIDDVGTKVAVSAVPAELREPSWVLETSPGNYQWGYVLDVLEEDAGRAAALLDGMVRSGLCSDGKDPGMKGVTRYVRLPEGRNTKAKYGAGGFTCVLTSWEPARRFAMHELAEAFGITLPVPGAVSLIPGTGFGVDAKDDELFGWLDGWGLVTGRAADGIGYQMQCPWMDEHTGRADTGAAYWCGGGFVCHHGHGDVKKRHELERWVHDRAVAERGAGSGLSAWAFDVVPDYAPPHGRGRGGSGAGTGTRAVPVMSGAGAEDRFFDELVFVASEDRFWSLRTSGLVSRPAVDFAWGPGLKGLGVLPVVSPRTGEVMRPSAWFGEDYQTHRARMADGLTYAPGEDVLVEDGGAVLVNRWRPGERMGLPVTDADVEPWLVLVRALVECEGPWVADAVLDWMALVVGAPGVKPGWHVVLQGGQGIGKDMMLLPLRKGVGEHNVGGTSAAGLSGDFNAWAEMRLVVMTELKQTSRGSQTGTDQYNILKGLTENTSARIKINQKNQREYYARNVSAFVATSNDEQPLALEDDDRRFLVVRSEMIAWSAGEYARLRAWLDGVGADLCVEWLWTRWEGMDAARRAKLLGRAPMTPGKANTISLGEDPSVAWMREQIETGTWPDLMTGADIGAALAGAAKSGAAGFRFAPSPNRWGAAIKRIGGDKVYGGNQVRLLSGVKTRLWATRGPERFKHVSEAIIARMYVSSAAAAFSAPGERIADKVVNITST